MHAKKSQQDQQAQAGGNPRQLATSAFNGEARLRELLHLADTARKVRDQAASELTRSGSTHHIARDRIGAAERMLRKTQQEIAELRAQLGSDVGAATAPQQPKPQDLELAMMLGHSKARFNRDEAAQTAYEIQQDAPMRGATKTAGKSSLRKPQHKTTAAKPPRTVWRTLAFAVLLTIGAGLGAVGTYALATTGSLNEAAQTMRTATLQLVDKLRVLIPNMSLPAGAVNSQSAVDTGLSQVPATTSNRVATAQQTLEQQARAAAEQRLARQISSLEKPHR